MTIVINDIPSNALEIIQRNDDMHNLGNRVNILTCSYVFSLIVASDPKVWQKGLESIQTQHELQTS